MKPLRVSSLFAVFEVICLVLREILTYIKHLIALVTEILIITWKLLPSDLSTTSNIRDFDRSFEISDIVLVK